MVLLEPAGKEGAIDAEALIDDCLLSLRLPRVRIDGTLGAAQPPPSKTTLPLVTATGRTPRRTIDEGDDNSLPLDEFLETKDRLADRKSWRADGMALWKKFAIDIFVVLTYIL